MSVLDHMFRSLFAAWRLLLGDDTAIDQFEASFEGFLKSFLAALLCAPFFAILVYLVGPIKGADAYAFFFVLSWLATPLVMYPLLRLLALSDRFFMLIVAINWAQVLILGMFLVAFLIMSALPESNALRAGGSLLTFAVSLFYSWFVVRTALGSSGTLALGIIFIDAMVSTALRWATLLS